MNRIGGGACVDTSTKPPFPVHVGRDVSTNESKFSRMPDEALAGEAMPGGS